ncbi:TKL protein kinase [Saprolegnia diclina VS20]|uniref:TKL protein kinase n=1 Tax=Saprolegnia diclina (strain VS20) TaxID=1156394 RepID=T0RD38_SAPDV|nr:TKL protein kinase [Saprolegnia diclina VS20]EQC30158.1 TKL protein kinase [Saprolegnia diclina VS20]|eukprot:XP_008616501.1 TKL protein kinase [Saprolegnia diclina VS20]
MFALATIAASAIAAAVAQSPCPYSEIASTKIFAFGSPYCSSASSYCLLDSTCAVTEASLSSDCPNPWESSGANTRVPCADRVTAIGDIRASARATNDMRLVVRHSELVSTAKMVLPQELAELTLQYASFPPGATFTWPIALKKLWIEKSGWTQWPANLPASITHLRVLDLNFTALPPQLDNLQHVSVFSPALTQLVDLDWSKLAHLRLGVPKGFKDACALTTFVNVTLSSTLRRLDLAGCHLTKLHLSQESYAAIANFTLTRNNTDARDANDFKSTVDDTTIVSDPAACAAVGGALTPLWPQFQEVTRQVYTVCVTPATVAALPPVSAVATASSDASGSDVGLAVGASVGGVALIGFVAFALMKRRRSLSPTPTPKTPDDNNGHESGILDSTFAFHTNTDAPMSTAMQEIHSRSLEELAPIKLDDSSLQLKSILGSGASADVWFGYYRGDAVAIKRFVHRDSADDTQAFVDEIQLLQRLDSPYIVRMIGASWTRPTDLKCILEYMDQGDLREFLLHHTPIEFNWAAKTRSLWALAKGMVYLHANTIIHRDLKSRNVLLDSKKGTKLTDFGVARVDVQATMTAGVGTFRWMAPEVLMYGRYSVAADIYSFGMLLSEYDTHAIPYDDKINPTTGLPLVDTAIMARVLEGSIQPTFSASCPDWIYNMAMACLKFDPNDRPTATELVDVYIAPHLT